MDMYDPPHPGEIVREDCLKALELSVTEAAKGLGRLSRRFSTAAPASRRKWRYGCPRRSGARPSTGCRCSLPTICGKRSAKKLHVKQFFATAPG